MPSKMLSLGKPMPYYDYKCEACEHVWEVHHGMSEEPKLECPECSKSDIVKLVSRIAFTYVKGNGFLDVEGRRRDMHLYKLQNDDPYGHMRPPGDKEVIEQKLKNAGKIGYDKNGNRIQTKFYQNKKAETKKKKGKKSK